jgi:hypothetical protein
MVKQITVSLENSLGRLHDTTKLLGEAGVNLRAVSLASATDFGVARMLVSDVALARKLLMQNHVPARIDEVVVVEIPDRPRSLEGMLAPLVEQNISVQYMYAFAGPKTGTAVLVVRFSDPEKAMKVLEANGTKILTAGDLGIENAD